MMLTTFTKKISSPIEQKIVDEEKKYQAALKADKEFHVLQGIRQKIKRLKAELSEQRLHQRINN